jgi:hypothetical protein
MPSKLIGFGSDIPADKCEAIWQRDPRPLVMSLEAEIDEPHMVELLAAVTTPVPERVRLPRGDNTKQDGLGVPPGRRSLTSRWSLGQFLLRL